MKFDKTLELMKNSKFVMSEVSKTVYSLSTEGNGKLFAEGLEVSADYITEEEMLGDWNEVNIIQSEEELRKLPDEAVEKMLKDAYVKYQFDMKTGKRS